MAAILVKGSQFNSLGMALTASSCVEQVNGLVEVQARFFVDKSRQSEIDRLFFVDSQPPIDPSCVTKASLLTQRLYMVTRSVSSENGFLVIDASYVGALARPGSRGFYLTEEKGPEETGWSILGQFSRSIPSTVISNASINEVYVFQFYSKEITAEFVQIGNLTATALPQFSFFDLFVLLRIISAFGPGDTTSDPLQKVFDTRFLGTKFDDPMFPPTPTNRVEEPATFLTPTVKVAKVRFFI
jgi:hypothetical protein